jgi:hypothetical protein
MPNHTQIGPPVGTISTASEAVGTSRAVGMHELDWLEKAERETLTDW